MATFMAAGATKEYRALRNDRRTSAAATNGTMRNITRTMDAARTTWEDDRPGAVRRTRGSARTTPIAHNAIPTATEPVSTSDINRFASIRSLATCQVEKVGTSAWVETARASTVMPTGIRAATKKASVIAPAP